MGTGSTSPAVTSCWFSISAFDAVASFRNAYLENCQESLRIRTPPLHDIGGIRRRPRLQPGNGIVRLGHPNRHRRAGLRRETLRSERRRGPAHDRQAPVEQCALRYGRHVCKRHAHRAPCSRVRGPEHVGVRATLPEGVHNARPFRDGILFNDTEAGALRFESPATGKAFPLPRLPPHKILHADPDGPGGRHPGFGRGLCVISEKRDRRRFVSGDDFNLRSRRGEGGQGRKPLTRCKERDPRNRRLAIRMARPLNTRASTDRMRIDGSGYRRFERDFAGERQPGAEVRASNRRAFPSASGRAASERRRVAVEANSPFRSRCAVRLLRHRSGYRCSVSQWNAAGRGPRSTHRSAGSGCLPVSTLSECPHTGSR